MKSNHGKKLHFEEYPDDKKEENLVGIWQKEEGIKL